MQYDKKNLNFGRSLLDKMEECFAISKPVRIYARYVRREDTTPPEVLVGDMFLYKGYKCQ
jgi:hypothetical protein